MTEVLNEKYVLVLVQRDDHELDKFCLRLTLVFDSCKTKQIYLIRDCRIMTMDSNRNLIYLHFGGALRVKVS